MCASIDENKSTHPYLHVSSILTDRGQQVWIRVDYHPPLIQQLFVFPLSHFQYVVLRSLLSVVMQLSLYAWYIPYQGFLSCLSAIKCFCYRIHMHLLTIQIWQNFIAALPRWFKISEARGLLQMMHRKEASTKTISWYNASNTHVPSVSNIVISCAIGLPRSMGDTLSEQHTKWMFSGRVLWERGSPAIDRYHDSNLCHFFDLLPLMWSLKRSGNITILFPAALTFSRCWEK